MAHNQFSTNHSWYGIAHTEEKSALQTNIDVCTKTENDSFEKCIEFIYMNAIFDMLRVSDT